jgi:competence protein comGC
LYSGDVFENFNANVSFNGNNVEGKMKKLKQFIMKNKRVKGFTLVEMVIVIAIIAMLILLIVPGLSKQKERATSKTDEALRTTVETQRQLAADNGDGTSLEELVKKEYISQKQKERYEKLPQK